MMDRIENILDTGGRYLSTNDRQFVSTLLSELEQFQYQAPKDRALMFHPLGGFQRYLIHKVTDVFPKLTSFSIGDDSNRRTVVCFKSKKKDQQLGFQQGAGAAKTTPTPSSTYMPSPQRGHGDEGSRHTLPEARSRDSSRSRKKSENADSPYSKTLPRNSKPETSSHLPRPLRSKKAATKRDQMKRSRSLQSSPVHADDQETYLTDDDVHRGRRRAPSDKRGQRSSSLKPPSRRRERHVSPDISDDDGRLRKPQLRHNVSDVSLVKRSQGLRMEGKVVNGDIEDPYSYGDSESDAARVDAAAVQREKDHHKRRNPPEPKRHHERKHSYDSSVRSFSEDSDFHQDTRKKTNETHRKKQYPDSESDARSYHDNEELYSQNGDEDFDSVDTDERPPSYTSLKRSASQKKAERNLNRIRRGDSQRKPSKPSDHESTERDSSSSCNSKHNSRPKRASSSSRPAHKEVSAPKRSSTMPRSMKEPGKKADGSAKRSHTLKNTGSNTEPRIKSQGTQSEKHSKTNSMKESPKRSSTSSSKSRPKSKTFHSKEAVTEIDGPNKSKSQAASTDDLLDGSNATLYMPLPDTQPKTTKPAEKKTKNRHHSMKGQGSKQTKSAPATPVVDNYGPETPSRCDMEAQTDVTGTLTRRKVKDNNSTPTTTYPGPDAWSGSKQPVDVLSAMMQSLGVQQQGNPPFQQSFNPNSLNAFQQFMQSNPQSTQAPYPPLPPHLMHQLYMSWLGAYYAGVTGTWPPPAMPSFMAPPSSSSSANNQMPPFDMGAFLNPANMAQYPRYPATDSRRPTTDSRDDQGHYYDQYYPPTTQPSDYPSHHNQYSDNQQPGEDQKYPYSSSPGPDHMSSISHTGSYDEAPSHHHNYTNPAFDESTYQAHSVPEPTPESQKHGSRTGGKKKFEPKLDNGHNSFVLTDGETDASSVVSSGTKGEIAVASNPKGGVMIYVRSQPNSRTSSTAGTHESVDSLNTSDNIQSLGSTPRTSEHGSQPNISEMKKSHRDSRGKARGKTHPSSLAKNGLGSRKVKGESVTNNKLQPTNGDASVTNHSHVGSPLHVADTLLEQIPPPVAYQPVKIVDAPTTHSTPLYKSSNKSNSDSSLNASSMLKEADISHEEMILSLRRAPLATIEDDADGFLSASHASSSSSLYSAQPDEKASKSSSQPSVSTLPQSSNLPERVPSTDSSSLPESEREPKAPEDVVEDASTDSDESSESSSVLEVRNKETGKLSEERSSHSSDSSDESDINEVDDFPRPPSSLILTLPEPDHTNKSETQQTPTEENLSPPPPYSSPSSGAFTPPLFEVPLIDNSDEEDVNSSTSSSDESDNSSQVKSPIIRNGMSDSSSVSEGNNDNNPSDSSYDADQSRVDETSQPKKSNKKDLNLHNSLVKEMDGDVVVQDPELDYYNWEPNQDKWKDEKYKRFIEVYNVSPPSLSDIDITTYMSKYRGLRLSRVDSSHALCMLPSPKVAAELLKEEFSAFDTRPLNEATIPTKEKAQTKLENDEFEAVRATRPATDNTVAKRMIAGALGNSKYASPSDKRVSNESKRNKK